MAKPKSKARDPPSGSDTPGRPSTNKATTKTPRTQNGGIISRHDASGQKRQISVQKISEIEFAVDETGKRNRSQPQRYGFDEGHSGTQRTEQKSAKTKKSLDVDSRVVSELAQHESDLRSRRRTTFRARPNLGDEERFVDASNTPKLRQPNRSYADHKLLATVSKDSHALNKVKQSAHVDTGARRQSLRPREEVFYGSPSARPERHAEPAVEETDSVPQDKRKSTALDRLKQKSPGSTTRPQSDDSDIGDESDKIDDRDADDNDEDENSPPLHQESQSKVAVVVVPRIAAQTRPVKPSQPVSVRFSQPRRKSNQLQNSFREDDRIVEETTPTKRSPQGAVAKLGDASEKDTTSISTPKPTDRSISDFSDSSNQNASNVDEVASLNPTHTLYLPPSGPLSKFQANRCASCVRHKRQCDGQRPCNECMKKGIPPEDCVPRSIPKSILNLQSESFRRAIIRNGLGSARPSAIVDVPTTDVDTPDAHEASEEQEVSQSEEQDSQESSSDFEDESETANGVKINRKRVTKREKARVDATKSKPVSDKGMTATKGGPKDSKSQFTRRSRAHSFAPIEKSASGNHLNHGKLQPENNNSQATNDPKGSSGTLAPHVATRTVQTRAKIATKDVKESTPQSSIKPLIPSSTASNSNSIGIKAVNKKVMAVQQTTLRETPLRRTRGTVSKLREDGIENLDVFFPTPEFTSAGRGRDQPKPIRIGVRKLAELKALGIVDQSTPVAHRPREEDPIIAQNEANDIEMVETESQNVAGERIAVTSDEGSSESEHETDRDSVYAADDSDNERSEEESEAEGIENEQEDSVAHESDDDDQDASAQDDEDVEMSDATTDKSGSDEDALVYMGTVPKLRHIQNDDNRVVADSESDGARNEGSEMGNNPVQATVGENVIISREHLSSKSGVNIINESNTVTLTLEAGPSVGYDAGLSNVDSQQMLPKMDKETPAADNRMSTPKLPQAPKNGMQSRQEQPGATGVPSDTAASAELLETAKTNTDVMPVAQTTHQPGKIATNDARNVDSDTIAIDVADTEQPRPQATKKVHFMLDNQMPTAHDSADTVVPHPSKQSDLVLDSSYMQTRRRSREERGSFGENAEALAVEHDRVPRPIGPPKKKRKLAQMPVQVQPAQAQPAEAAIEDVTADPAHTSRSIHVYECVTRPSFVRFMLNGWERTSTIDWIQENVTEPNLTNIPAEARYILIAEDIILKPWGSALFWATFDPVTQHYNFVQGYYYHFDKIGHSAVPCLKKWADDSVDSVVQLLTKHESISPLDETHGRFDNIFNQMRKAINAEMQWRQDKQLVNYFGPGRRRVYRHKNAILDQ